MLTDMPQRIFASVKDSCERLQTEYIDVFQVGPRRAVDRTKLMTQCHRFDNDTPVSSVSCQATRRAGG